jgi:hypothetical protein
MHGTSIFQIEVTQVSSQGFWLLLPDEELFLSFKDFPWFKSARFEEICAVESPSFDHLYWPQLDIDLSLASIRKPSDFSLISQVNRNQVN